MAAAPKIPLSSVEPRVPLTYEQKVELEIKKVGGSRSKRNIAQGHGRVRTKEYFDEIEDAVKSADESRTWEDKSTQELSEKIVRKHAKIVLLGGPMFYPTTLKEATEAGAAWSKIATAEAVRAGRMADPEGELTAEQEAAIKLAEQIKQLRKGSAARSAARRAAG